MTQFGEQSTVQEVLEGIDLSGKRVLITGGTSGLGLESAAAVAKAGAEIIITARDRDKFQLAVKHINERQQGAKVHFCHLELDDVESCRGAAKGVCEQFDNLDFIIANAGVMACDKQQTKQGFEWQFGVNHLGHFVFVNHLIPLLKDDHCRITVVSSNGHIYSNVDFDDPNFETTEYDKWVSYGRAKTANVLYAVELNRRMPKGNANAVHPGAIITNLSRHMKSEDQIKMGSVMKDSGIVFKTVEAGAATQVWAISSAELEGLGGLYLEDCHIAEEAGEFSGGYCPYVLDAEAAKRLWLLSEDLVGEAFTFD